MEEKISLENLKGIWIRAEILGADDLTAREKMILAVIDMCDNRQGCFVTNNEIAELCLCDSLAVSKAIKKLNALGYLHVKHLPYGRRRRMLQVMV